MTPAEPRQLIVCCDGTWFKPEGRAPSHVGRIAKLAATRPGGAEDLVYYTRGVGGRYGLDKFIGGGFGSGLDANIKDAYNFLAHNYIGPSAGYVGDQIFMFGFSRGAYTVRSLAAMIDKVGLLRRESVMRLGDAYRVYRARPGETAFDDDTGNPIILEPDIVHVDIQFVGVFDTVGAKGIPFAGLDRTRRFIDLEMPARVRYGRHAMALNEPRSQFRPAVWEGVCGADGSTESGGPPRVAQTWFAGAHSDVGGGYDRSAMGNSGHLGAHTLKWMLDEARECGLMLDQVDVDRVIEGLGPDSRAPEPNFILHDSMSFFYFVLDKLLYLQRPIMQADFRFHRRYVSESGAVNQSLHESAAKAYLSDAPGNAAAGSILLSHKWALNSRERRFRFSRNVELQAVADEIGPEARLVELETVIRADPSAIKRVAGIVLGVAALVALVAAVIALVVTRGDIWRWLTSSPFHALLPLLFIVAAWPLILNPYLLHKRLYSYRFMR